MPIFLPTQSMAVQETIIISGSGDDFINGGSGSDIIISGSGNDTINGGSGDDIIISGSGDDTISGGSGNDLILSGSGDDIIDAGSGDDAVISGSGNDVISGGSGDDLIVSGSGDDTASGDSGNDTIISGAGNDTVYGNEGHDIIITGSGNDIVFGDGGNDIIVTGAGDDIVDGGNGHDVILSGQGADTVNGGNGDDVIITGSGNDEIDGGAGQDWIHAGADNDIINAGAGNDYINGGSEYDIAVFDGNYQDYSISLINTNCYTVTNNTTGEIDTVVNVELLRFADIDIDPANPTVNSDPLAQNDAATVDEDSSVVINALANDSDLDGDSLTVTTASAANGSAVINIDGTVTYTPNADFNGQDTISYEISDGQGGTATAEVSVTVNAVNDGPVAQNDVATVDEDSSVIIDVLSNDSDLDGDSLTVTTASAANGSVVINIDGTVTYTPNADFNGQDTISYEISDGQGGTATAEAAVSVNVPNDAPVAQDDSATVNEGASVIIDVLANDSDLDGDSLIVTTASAANGSVVINIDGTVTYTPNANFYGQDTIAYEISDGNGGTATADVLVAVNALNNTAPVANDDEATVQAGSNTVIANLLFIPGAGFVDGRLMSNDFDPDGDSLSITKVEGQTMSGQAITVPGSNGGFFTVYSTGMAEFDATTGFENIAQGNSATSSITYTISDGKGGTDSATVTVTINGLNDNPTAVDDAASTDESSSVVIDVLANDSDVDGEILSISSVDTSSLSGQLVDNGDGTFTYDANQQFDYLNDGETATDFFQYTIDDGLGGLDTAQVLITIQGSTVNVDTSSSVDTSTPLDTSADAPADGSNDFMV